MKKRVAVAMSGGVDSSASALILQEQGFEVSGITLRLFGEDIAPSNKGDIEDAAAVCAKIGINFEVLDLSSEFEKAVIDYFTDSYLSGGTPNPCVVCNKNIKFGKLLDYAIKKGFDFLATGHYARTEEKDGRVLLKKGVNEKKDQSYVLWSLTQEQLKRVVFPIGGMSKDEVRSIAASGGFVNSGKADSQDICFIKEGDYREFLKKRLNKEFERGNFVSKDGDILGTHNGAVCYTTGQRKGLGISFTEPLFVVSKDMQKNTVTLGRSGDLFSKSLTAREMNYIPFDDLKEPMTCKAKIRYKAPPAEAVVFPLGGNRARVEFAEPQRAITPGQSVVFYDGDFVVGGGIIE